MSRFCKLMKHKSDSHITLFMCATWESLELILGGKAKVYPIKDDYSLVNKMNKEMLRNQPLCNLLSAKVHLMIDTL